MKKSDGIFLLILYGLWSVLLISSMIGLIFSFWVGWIEGILACGFLSVLLAIILQPFIDSAIKIAIWGVKK